MICRFHRHRIDRALDHDRLISTATLAHCDQCDACRRHLEDQRRTVDILTRASAQREIENAPTWLFTRIRAQAAAMPRRRTLIPSGGLGSAVAAAAVTIVAIAFWLSTKTGIPPHSAPVVTRPSEVTASHAKPVLGASLLEALERDPLQAELELITSDTRAALDFLAASFVPGRTG